MLTVKMEENSFSVTERDTYQEDKMMAKRRKQKPNALHLSPPSQPAVIPSVEDKDDALEKIQDIQNYLTSIWCAINEDNDKENNDFDYDFEENIYNCEDCKFSYIGDNDDDWDKMQSKIIVEPCKSCKNNFAITEKEYETANLNFIPKNI